MFLLLGLLAFYMVILVIVAVAALRPARSFIFLSPDVLGAKTEPANFKSQGIPLTGLWLPHETPKAVFILSHGYVMNRAENAALAAHFQSEGYAALIYDNRGSGKSGGRQVGVGWLEKHDVIAACKHAEAKYPNANRILMGSSMGAAASAFALAEDPAAADALILDSCYHSLATATLSWWRFIGGVPMAILLAPVVLVAWPLARFNPFKANVGNALKSIDKPILILHGKKDRIAPPFHAEKNAKANPNAKLVWFESAGHSEARWTETEDFLKAISEFLAANNMPSKN